MSEEELNQVRDQTRRLCAERGLAIVPYGPSWWIVGDGVDRVVTDLAQVTLKDLEPRLAEGRRMHYRNTAVGPQQGFLRCLR